MPDAAKVCAGGGKNDTKAPVIGSPTKSKAGGASPVKKLSKEAVKLPCITPSSPKSPKESSKSEGPSSLPSATALTPTSPSRPKAKQSSKAGGKTSLAPVKAKTTNDRVANPEGTGSPLETLTMATTTTLVGEAGAVQADLLLPLQQVASGANTAAEAAAVAEAARAQAEEEAASLRKENGNGMVKLIYEQYDELFPIVDGSTTQAAIDDVYCLSFVMPNCLVRLSCHPNTERFERENKGVFDSLVPEAPRGTYHTLVKDETYYVVVEQEEDQLRRDQETTKAKWAPAVQQDKLSRNDDGRGFESCSCIYGNPCVDEYGCKDWHSRFAVATTNGWKGF